MEENLYNDNKGRKVGRRGWQNQSLNNFLKEWEHLIKLGMTTNSEYDLSFWIKICFDGSDLIFWSIRFESI